jgi:iron only hydrogenase large subunit-like protein
LIGAWLSGAGGPLLSGPLSHLCTAKAIPGKVFAVFPGKARSAFPWELRKNKEIEQVAVSAKRRTTQEETQPTPKTVS